ncbi:hypothetical protein AB1Y20_020277 [Prymnesium parvum]|uniref:Alpha-1,4-N-acetylglucosaminyltransferase n=1 Tax=Prymnesium parvum TaxID=97485 RepID=A0AB34JWM6_PRYPA|mmetsp:Transcript_3270/g.6994  ORF Transcript_3270/g.6994 Transcript_3270/m.6994 type:complete len:223 (+) Transcript_3270:29-697(+)
MYRSDVCRLAQLYFHGGLYMDNDIELLVPLGPRLRPGVTCNVDYRINDANNAILAAPPRHKIVVYCLKIFDQIARGARMHDPKHNGYYGPAILGEAIRKLYGSYQSEVNRAAMISSGLQLLVERSYFSSNNKTLLTQPHLRGRRGPCGMNIVNESDGEVLAFSRVKKYSHPLEPCSGAHFWRLPDHTPDRLACIVERALGHPHFRRGRDGNFTASPKMRLRR